MYFLFCCFLSQSAGILLFSTETMNATCTQNRFRKCKPTDPQQKQSWRTFCLNLGSKEVLPYCASEEVKWTDFKMRCTIHSFSPGSCVQGTSRLQKAWQGWSKGPWSGMDENWYPVLVAVTVRKLSLLLSPWNPEWWGSFLVWFLLSDLSMAVDCTWLSVLTAACFLIVEGLPSGTSCSRENACFPSVFP